MSLQLDLLMAPLRTPTPVRRLFARAVYEAVSVGYRMTLRHDEGSAESERDVVESTFMNYGYYDRDAEPRALHEQLQAVRHQIDLYEHVIDGVQLRGKDVVEVGCGRGGGAAWIAEQMEPATLLGVDLSATAIGFCRARHTAPSLSFMTGTAESLPLADCSVDVVVNVESSHMYAMRRFLSEVARVLRPGGLLCWADSRTDDQIGALHRAFAASGLHQVKRCEITAEVTAALEATAEHRTQIITRSFPTGTHYLLKTILGVPGTPLFQGYETGALRYESAVLQKPEAQR